MTPVKINKTLTALLFFSVFLAQPVLADVEISDGSVKALYHYNDDSADSSGNGHSGTDTNMSYGSDKLDDKSIYNGTTGYISFSDHADFKPTTAISVNLWFKNSTVSQAGFFQNWSQNPNQSGWRVWRNGSSEIRMDIGRNTGTSENTDWKTVTYNLTNNDDTWRMLTFTYDKSLLKLYVNANLVATSSFTYNIGYAGTNYVRAGALNNSGGNLFGSTPFDQDETAIFNKALSQEEINTLWNGGTGNEICVTAGCADPPALATSTECALDDESVDDDLLLSFTKYFFYLFFLMLLITAVTIFILKKLGFIMR